MPSPDLLRTLYAKEVRSLFSVKAFWIMLLILSLLTGYSFIQAVSLFSQASRTAMQYPEMARGMAPLDGVFVPTFGALYLITTLLFPFVAIRLVSLEKQSGSLKLLMQSPLNLWNIIAVKAAALGLGWILALVPAISSIFIWTTLGGHTCWAEIANLTLGYTLYAFIIAGIAFLAAALTDSTATAAILTLAFTLGSWVLDFAAGTQSWLHAISALSLTDFLRTFEHGLFSLSLVTRAVVSALSFVALSVIWLHPGTSVWAKFRRSALIIATGILLGIPAGNIRVYRDVSENRSNSFNPADEQALSQMAEQLTVTVHLSREDSRLHDYRRNVLNKLQRTVPDMITIYPCDSGNTLLGTTATDDNYGTVEYDYAGNHDESSSNSPREVLPLIHQLAGQTVTPDSLSQYPGYPLVADTNSRASRIWFYALLPLLLGVSWWASCKFKGINKKGKRPGK